MIAVLALYTVLTVTALGYGLQQRALRLTAVRDAQDTRLQLETLAVVSGKNDAWLRGTIASLMATQSSSYSEQSALIAKLTSPPDAPVINLGSPFPEEVDDIIKRDDFDPTDAFMPPPTGESFIAPDVEFPNG